MFIGHYGVGFALKKADKNISLGLLLFASQFVDIVWGLLLLSGIERVNIVPGITAANPLDFVYYPYTHSLAATVFWTASIYLVFRILPVKWGSSENRAAFVMAAAVVSHFFLDLLVHIPDLPLLGDDSYKLGFGLWNHPMLAYVVEGCIFLAGVWMYLKCTTGKTFAGKYGIIIFAGFLLVLNLLNLFAPPPPSPTVLAAFGLGYHVLFSGVAYWIDNKRIHKPQRRKDAKV